LVRHLVRLDKKIANVVELHPYTTSNELSLLAYKVELKKRVKGKGEASKPPIRNYPFQKPPYTPKTYLYPLIYNHLSYCPKTPSKPFPMPVNARSVLDAKV